MVEQNDDEQPRKPKKPPLTVPKWWIRDLFDAARARQQDSDADMAAFVGISYSTFNRLRNGVTVAIAQETFDRIMQAYTELRDPFAEDERQGFASDLRTANASLMFQEELLDYLAQLMPQAAEEHCRNLLARAAERRQQKYPSSPTRGRGSQPGAQDKKPGDDPDTTE